MVIGVRTGGNAGGDKEFVFTSCAVVFGGTERSWLMLMLYRLQYKDSTGRQA